MTAAKLLADLRRAGVVLNAHGDRLSFDAPAGAMTPDRLAAVKARKGELLAVMAGDYHNAAAALVLCVADPERQDALAFMFDERCAIVEIDGGLSRGQAQRTAYIDLARAVEGSAS